MAVWCSWVQAAADQLSLHSEIVTQKNSANFNTILLIVDVKNKDPEKNSNCGFPPEHYMYSHSLTCQCWNNWFV